ncbi:rho guanine nucleotide exchange factor 28 [Denticeps clupeoides]|uniref:rho guanine nucleotide exchange factor 28 n=1 Tax=Denticeps clupeoides TaxID=299321 RepID=UPI0010A4876A|nr:rho guanine nucleotide exchange factor 28-like [Denticeps clupeoides]
MFSSPTPNLTSNRRRSNSEGCGQVVIKGSSCLPVSSSSMDSTHLGEISDQSSQMSYTAESWSVLVEPEFYNSLDKQNVKRQEIIYELMQTEFHHVQTLTIMDEVLRQGLLEEVQLEQDVIVEIFPCVDKLLPLHRNFLMAMEVRQQDSTFPKSQRNFIIQRIGDILFQQFSGAGASEMTSLYAEFCSRHHIAVGVYKQLLQSNRKLQAFIRLQKKNLDMKRREIPELLLLVTQRITKYPVLLERLLHYTEDGSVEACSVRRALSGLRSVLAGVERGVSERQRAQKLAEILHRLDSRSCTRTKSGETFSKQELLDTHPPRTLTHSGPLTCRTSSGRLREVLGVLMTDVLVFLQEKEQKFTFAALEQKASLVFLQRLIVREVANEERGLFLITESSVGPEMYEIHTGTREERNTWLTHLTKAAHSLSEEHKQAKTDKELTVQKLQNIQECLLSLDMQVCVVLEEKLRVCANYSGQSHTDLLVWPHPQNTPQGGSLLMEARREVEKLAVALMLWFHPFIWPPGNDSKLLTGLEPASSPQLSHGHHLLFKGAVQTLTRLLYSLQATVIIQDSCFEVQDLLLQRATLLLPAGCGHGKENQGVACAQRQKCIRPEAGLRAENVSEAELLHQDDDGGPDCCPEEIEQSLERLRQEEERAEEEVERLREEMRLVDREREKLREEEIRVQRENLEVHQKILHLHSPE